MAPDILQLGAKWQLVSKTYFEACTMSLEIIVVLKTVLEI